MRSHLPVRIPQHRADLRHCGVASEHRARPPERENRQNAIIVLNVARPHRRQGIGTTLVGHAAGQAERAGRMLLMSDTRVGAPGTAFAQACGARAGIQEVRRVLHVDAGLLARVAGLRAGAEQHATGYSLRSWSGMTPDDLLEQASALHDAMEDAPHDASFEPFRWDADRLRKEEEQDIEAGMRINSVAALANDSGEMAALTQVYIDDPDQADWAYQGITAVTRAHRGDRVTPGTVKENLPSPTRAWSAQGTSGSAAAGPAEFANASHLRPPSVLAQKPECVTCCRQPAPAPTSWTAIAGWSGPLLPAALDAEA